MIRDFLNARPIFDDTNYIADSAEIIGDVRLGRGASIWFNATVRGDVNYVDLGEATNVQDNVVVHVTNRTAPTRIGNFVTIGHSAVLHGCTVHDRVLVGIGSIILDHAEIGHDTIIGAGTLITQKTRIPPMSLVLGRPGKCIRTLTPEEVANIKRYAERYLFYSEIYRGVIHPEKNPFYSRDIEEGLPDFDYLSSERSEGK